MADRWRQCEGCYRSEQCSEHLCYIVSQGFHLAEPQEYRVVEVDGQYRCDHCGRIARAPVRLCIPVKLPAPEGEGRPETGNEPTAETE